MPTKHGLWKRGGAADNSAADDKTEAGGGRGGLHSPLGLGVRGDSCHLHISSKRCKPLQAPRSLHKGGVPALCQVLEQLLQEMVYRERSCRW